MNIDKLRKKASALSLSSGVYLMKNESGTVIYVGKAKSLRSRVSQYFRNFSKHSAKVRAMVSNAADFEVLLTDTEFEALVLENNLIKHYKPKYNILLKDDKGYPFIRVAVNELFPSFSVVSKPKDDGASYYGPYGGRNIARKVIDVVGETLKLPSCSRKFPRDIGKGRPCINLEMKRCVGVCAGLADGEAYASLIGQAEKLLRGESDELYAAIEKEMNERAASLEFEKAAELRDRLRAVSRLSEKQNVTAVGAPDTDVICIFAGDVNGCAAVLHYMNGTLLGKDTVILPHSIETEDIPDTAEEFITQYYKAGVRIPKEIALSCDIRNAELLERWLSEKSGGRTKLFTPKRGQRAKLVNMAMENASDEVRRAVSGAERVSKLLQILKTSASLEKIPSRIEAYDVSNTAGRESVAGMVVFQDGKPRPSAYKRFKISEENEGDDYGSVKETLTRRFLRYKNGDEGFSELPDLILIDGGRNHAAVSVQTLREMDIQCKVLGMVKDDRHRTRALTDELGNETGLTSNPALFGFVGTIQEEAHRFALRYHKELRSRSVTSSSLLEIHGVGPATAEKLLSEFKTIKRIREADVQELSHVVPMKTALSIYRYYRERTREDFREGKKK